MSIPLRTDFRIRYSLRESIQINEEFLEERLHSFDWQKRISYEVAKKFLPFLSTLNEYEQNYVFNIDIKNDNLNQLVVVANKVIGIESNGQFYTYDSANKRATIYLHLVNSDILCGEEYIVRKIASILGHELSHAGTIIKRYENDAVDTGYIEQYKTIVQAIQNTVNYRTAIEKEIYEYAYALYCTSDLEITAFISQTEFELRKLANKDVLTTDEIKKYIRFTESYQAFSLAKEVALRVLNKTKYDKDWFVEKLKEYGLNVENIDKQMKHLEYRADYALEKCMANAMNTVETY